MVNERALLERLAKQRREEKPVPGTPPSPLARLWRRGLQLRARLRRVLKQPEAVLSKAELWQVIEDAVEAGRVWERLVWKEGGGIVGEVVKASESRLTRIEGLAKANRKREAWLTDGLKHKLNLICSCQPTISHRAVARVLLEESEEANRRCHHCQRSKWLDDDKAEMQCERYRLYNRCRECEKCKMWYECLSNWRSKRRKIFLKQKLPENKAGERLLDALARRIGTIRRSRRPRKAHGTEAPSAE